MKNFYADMGRYLLGFGIFLSAACSEHEIAPEEPCDPTPANGAMNVSRNAVLYWECSDADGDALSYDVYFGQAQAPPFKKKVTEKKYDHPETMKAKTKFYWQIIAHDDRGNSTPGPLWNFTTGGSANRPPREPNTPNPGDGATGIDINADLSWKCSDPDGDPVTYDIYFGGSSPPPLVKNNHGSKSYDPGTMQYNTKYYWKIVAEDNHDNRTPGPIWSFTTRQQGGNDTLELYWDNGTNSSDFAWYTGANTWGGNDFSISTLSAYTHIAFSRIYYYPNWPNNTWEGNGMAVFAFSGGVPGSILMPSRYVRGSGSIGGWQTYTVDWRLPGGVRDFVFAYAQLYNYPNCDPVCPLDTNPTGGAHSWYYYSGTWYPISSAGYGNRALMTRCTVDNTYGSDGKPSSFARVKANIASR